MTTPAGAVAGNAEAAQREAGERERAQPQGGGGFFGKKYGPLKGWQWSLAAGGLAIVYFYWRSRKKAQATGTSVSGTSTTGSIQGELDQLQAEIDQLQGGTATTGTGTGGGGGGGGPTTTTGIATTGTSHPTTGTSAGGGGGGGGTKVDPPTDPHMIRVGIYAARAGWDAPKSGKVTAYEVVRSGAGVNTTTGHQHSFVALKPSTHYTWKVRAVTASGKSSWVGGSFTTDKRKKKK